MDINECIRRAVAMVGKRRPPGVVLDLDLAPLTPRRCQPAQIAEAFFNLLDNAMQAVGEGTGLGLTVARDIVRAHGGVIAIDSEPGRGTTFTIRLPA